MDAALQTVPAMWGVFRAEAQRQCAVLNAGLDSFAAGAHAVQLESLSRAALAIKGAARIMELDAAVGITHCIERGLAEIQRSHRAPELKLIESLRAAVVWLLQLARVPATESAAWLRANDAARISVLERLGVPAASAETFTARKSAAPASPETAALLGVFHQETSEHTAHLTTGLLAAKSGKPADWESLTLAVQAIKDGAGLIGLIPVAETAAALEQSLSAAAQSGCAVKAAQYDALLAGTEWLSQAVQVAHSERSQFLGTDLENVIKRLRTTRDMLLAQSSAPDTTVPKIWDGKETASGTASRPALTAYGVYQAEVKSRLVALNTELARAGTDSQGECLAALLQASRAISGAAAVVDLPGVVEVANSIIGVLQSVLPSPEKLAWRTSALKTSFDWLDRAASATEKESADWLAKHESGRQAVIAQLRANPSDAAPIVIERIEPPVPQPGKPAHLEAPTRPSGTGALELGLWELFRQEVETYTAVLDDGLLAAEKGCTPDLIEPLMRAAHSIKGAARVMSLDAAVSVAHAMEDLLVAAQHGSLTLTSAHVDLLLSGVDWLRKITTVSEDNISKWLSAQEKDWRELLGCFKESLSSPQSAPKWTRARKADASLAPAGISGGETGARFVRVPARTLSQVMAHSGELLVEVRRMIPAVKNLQQLRRHQKRALLLLERVSACGFLGGEETQARRTLATAIEELRRVHDQLTRSQADFDRLSVRIERLSEGLHLGLAATRMRPFADGIRQFPRMVRDLARGLNKEVQLTILGRETQVDYDILEKLEAPLGHLIRNAVDHGIESPDERLTAGKPRSGTVRLEARHQAGMLVITVSDDGRGVDVERLRRKIVEKGLAAAAIAEKLNEPELVGFLFLPGFSTRDQVSEISGRGVGLDVVNSMVQEVQGSLRALPQPGQGLLVEMRLPVTLSVISALAVEIAGQKYAFPLSQIDRLLRVRRDELATEGRPFVRIENFKVPLAAAQRVLELPGSAPVPDVLSVVVIGTGERRFALAVNHLIGECELAVKALDPRLGKVPDIQAGAVLDDGSPVLILNVDELLRSTEELLSGARAANRVETSLLKKRRTKHVLVVDDSATVREVERKLLTDHGYEVTLANDGAAAWNEIRAGDYDLVVSDVDMPHMNGYELVRNIRQDPALGQLPVVMVSYRDREEDRVRGLEAGANQFLGKSTLAGTLLAEAVSGLIGEAECPA